MNNQVSEHAVELLDRKYKFVLESSTETFLLDLGEFMQYLTQDEIFSFFTASLIKRVSATFEKYLRQLEAEKREAIKIMEEMLSQHPELDDSNQEKTGGMEDNYSFARFNEIASNARRGKFYRLFPDTLDDDSDVAILISILQVKLNSYSQALFEKSGSNVPPQSLLEIRYRLDDLGKLHKFTHLEWINYSAISPGTALLRLIEITKRINPEPEDETEFRKLSFDEQVSHAFQVIFTQERFLSWVPDATYAPRSNYARSHPNDLTNENLEKKFLSIKKDLRRIYEAIRQEIGTTRLHLQLLDRYRMRCNWYNQSYLRKQVENRNGTYVRNREEILTRDLVQCALNPLRVTRREFLDHFCFRVSPLNRFRVVVDIFEVSSQVLFQSLYARKVSRHQQVALHFTEDDLDLIKPTGVLRQPEDAHFKA